MSGDIPVTDLLTTFIERLHGSETLEVEVKLAQGGIPKSLWETVSAFANTNGGWIFLGVKEVDKRLEVEGLPNPSKMLDDFYNQLRNPQKINYPICSAQDARIETLDGKDILIIRVPEAPRQQRPVHINGNPYQGTYVRRNTGDHHCTKPEVDRMMREASDVGADSAILPGFNLDDIDKDALARYRQLDQNLHPGEPRNTYDDLRFLTTIGGYARERATGQEGLTVAGLLLLGKERAIREWRSRHLIDYRMVLTEDNPDKRWDDRVPWEGHLFGAFENIYARLKIGLSTAFQLQGATRIEESPVHVVLREALMNLLIHADYAIPEASLIFRTPSGFLWNEAEQLALVHAKHEGYVDNASLTRLTGQHPADISKVLVGLRKRQFLQMIIGGRYACYELGLRAISGTRMPTNTVTSPTKQETISENLWNELMQIGEVIRSYSRVNRVTLETTIVKLCALAPLGVNDLETILQRKKTYLLKIISRLIDLERINYLYSHQPNHPRQKYVALEEVGEDNTIQQTALDLEHN